MIRPVLSRISLPCPVVKLYCKLQTDLVGSLKAMILHGRGLYASHYLPLVPWAAGLHAGPGVLVE